MRKSKRTDFRRRDIAKLAAEYCEAKKQPIHRKVSLLGNDTRLAYCVHRRKRTLTDELRLMRCVLLRTTASKCGKEKRRPLCLRSESAVMSDNLMTCSVSQTRAASQEDTTRIRHWCIKRSSRKLAGTQYAERLTLIYLVFQFGALLWLV